MVDRTGEQLGNYRLVRLLGQGGFAEVYLGEHIDLGTKAAIKVLHTQLSPTDIDVFRTEARTIARLLHPHIIRVLDFNAAGSTPFLVMDYAAGGTMRERYPRGTIIPLITIVSYIQQVAEALQYAHDEKLIHRDIKPENILLDQRDNILLSDFGIALIAQSSRYQNTQDVIGTAAYMSPEQILGKPRPASDQYSLGIVVYEWLSGIRPFVGSLTELWSQHVLAPPPSLCAKVPTISQEVEHVIMTALQKDPKQRFGSVRAFAIALLQASQAGMPPTAPAALTILPRPTQTPPAQQVQQQPASQTLTHEAPQAIPLQEKQIRLAEFIQIIRNKWGLTPKDTMELLHLPNLNNMNYRDLLRQLEPLVEQRKQAQTPPAQQVQQQAVPQTPAREAPQAIPLQEKRPAARPAQPAGAPIGAEIPVTPNLSGSALGNIRLAEFIQIIRNKWGLTPREAMDLLHLESLNNMNYGDLLRQLEPLVKQRAENSPAQKSLASLPGQSPPIILPHPQANAPRPQGGLKWHFRARKAVQSSPVIVNDVVYFGSEDRNLYALDARSGQKIWSFQTRQAVKSSPVVVNNVVYFGSDKLYALDATSGQKIWSFSRGEMKSPPTIVNGIVYFALPRGSLYAVDASSGQKKWSFSLEGSFLSSLTVINGILYTGLYALDAASGQKIWSFPNLEKVSAYATLVNNVIYFGSDDTNLYALDAHSGQEKWHFFTGEWVRSSPIVIDGVVYFGSDNSFLYALDARSGQKKWSFSSTGGGDRWGDWVRSSPMVVNNVVYFGSRHRDLYALDAISGQQLWSFQGRIPASEKTNVATHAYRDTSQYLTVANNVVYFGSNDKNLYALDARSGQKKWSFVTGDEVSSLPAVNDGVVYFGSDDGNLYAIFA